MSKTKNNETGYGSKDDLRDKTYPRPLTSDQKMALLERAIQPGQTLVYNDGRAGHTQAECVVLNVSNNSMLVQFADRADSTAIKFNDSAWMKFLSIK